MCLAMKVPEGQHPIYPTIKVPAEIRILVKEKLNELGIKKYVVIGDFLQDIHGFGEFEPTFNWSARVSVMFENESKNGQFFQCTVKELNDEVINGVISKELMIEDFENAVETIKDFMDCICSIDNMCEYHATLSGSKEVVYQDI